MVPPPPGRHAEVRREPAQALPGHLQRQLGLPGLEGPVGRAPQGGHPMGRRRRQGVPGRQPAHQAVRVLALAHTTRPRARPRHRVPRRGVHPALGHAPAREDRVHPVLHVLHVEELALGADRVRLRARAHRTRATTSARTSSRTPPTSSTSTSSTAAGRRSRPGSSSPLRSAPHTGSTRATSTTRTSPCARARRST